jgi:hypothetical protein
MKNLIISPFTKLKKATVVLFAALCIAASPKPEELKVIITPGEFSVDKAKVTVKEDWKIETFRDVLGSGREQMGYNKTHSYDELGIVLFELLADSAPTGKVSEVQVYFPGYPTNSVAPKNYFKGTVNLDGLKISATAKVTPDKVRKALKAWKNTDSYMDHNFRFEKRGMYLYTQFNDADNAITKLSIGKSR